MTLHQMFPSQNRRHSGAGVKSFLLVTGQTALFICSETECLTEPVAEVVVSYTSCPDVSTLWCASHLPNLGRLERAETTTAVELLSTVSRPSRLMVSS